MAIMVVDGFLLGRKVNRLVDEKFPDNTESRLEARVLRRQPGLAAAADARAAAAGRTAATRSPESDGAHAGARRYPVGQVRVGRDRHRRSPSATRSGSLSRHRCRRRRRSDWAARVAAHRERRPRHWSTVETADVATQLRADDSAHRTLVDDLGGWLTAAMDRARAWTGGSVRADVDDLVDAVAGFSAPAGPGQPRGGPDGGAGDRSRAAASPTNSARSTNDWRSAVRPRGAGGRGTAGHGEGGRHDGLPADHRARSGRGRARHGPGRTR